MQTVLSGRVRSVGWILATLVSGCANQGEAVAPRVSERAAAPVDTSSKASPLKDGHDQMPFSGEIVFRLTAVSTGASRDTKDLGELHYFISGAHWKHVDASGDVAVLYDPESHLIHYFKPQAKTVDASLSDGPASFEALPDTRVVLGRTCKGVRWTTRDRKITAFYDPALFVDPAPFVNHHYGHWAETLAATSGALILWSDMELPQGNIISEPVSIQSREFEDSFWRVPEEQSSDGNGQH
jgi:hypothetical protein